MRKLKLREAHQFAQGHTTIGHQSGDPETPAYLPTKTMHLTSHSSAFKVIVLKHRMEPTSPAHEACPRMDLVCLYASSTICPHEAPWGSAPQTARVPLKYHTFLFLPTFAHPTLLIWSLGLCLNSESTCLISFHGKFPHIQQEPLRS